MSQELYSFEDIKFCNTIEFSRAAQHYKKHGCYTYAPDGSREHKEFWDEEERRRIEGMTLPGALKLVNGIWQMQEVHITGEHYGFLNYARIFRTKDDEDKKELKNVLKDSVLLKNARKVGKKDIDFPSFFDGQYHYFKARKVAKDNGLNMIVGKARRKGFSYIEGWNTGSAINLKPNVTILLCAFDLKYLTKGNQIMGMTKSYLDFLELNTDWNRGYVSESKELIQLGYKLPGTQIKRGYLGQVIALSFGGNADAAVGKDADEIKVEEMGKAKNVKEFLELTMSTTEAGDLQTGMITMFGTGGGEDENWEAFQDIHENPDRYDCMVFDNIWDEGARGTGCGFFYPHTLNLEPYIDEHGNSDLITAKASSDERRLKKKNSGISNREYIKYIGQRANNPKEAFAYDGDNIFTRPELFDHIQNVENNPDIKYLARLGTILRTERGLRFDYNETLEARGIPIHPPILDYPHKNNQDVHGCYVEWQSPFKIDGKIPKGLYRIWNDPYAIDKNKENITTKHSLACTYVFERANIYTPSRGDILVAMYIGRPETQDEYNEMLLRITEYWGGEDGQCMFENNTGDVEKYFLKNKKHHLLADEPEAAWKKELQSKKTGRKGVLMNPSRIGAGALAFRDWVFQKRGIDEYGNEKMNLHYIYDVGLLREMIKFNSKGNFDRLSTIFVGMMDVQEQFDKEVQAIEKEDPDDYFNRKKY